MAYTLKIDAAGNSFTVDAANNTTSTPFTLYPQGNGVEYGEGFQNNLVHVLENFAGPTEPAIKIPGLMWYNTAITPPRLQLWTTGNEWKMVTLL